MPQLTNPKHEKFAYNLAKGMNKGDAYVHAGYNESAASATRLSQTPQVMKRIEEHREAMMNAAGDLLTTPNEDTATAIVDMGLSLEWCAQQYKAIASDAKKAGQFAAATAAVKNIQAIVELDGKRDSKADKDEKELVALKVLDGVSKLLEHNNNSKTMIDITPVEPKKNVVNMQLLGDIPDAN